MSSNLDTATIRKLLLSAFNDDELNTFCFDHFYPVYNHFSVGMGRLIKIQLLIEHCKRHGKLNILLDRIRESNPYQFESYISLPSVSEQRKSLRHDSSSVIEIKIDGDFSKLNEEQMELALSAFRGALAGILKIPHETINILEVRVGSIIIKLELPSTAATQLLGLHEQKDPVTEDLGILQIIDHQADALFKRYRTELKKQRLRIISHRIRLTVLKDVIDLLQDNENNQWRQIIDLLFNKYEAEGKTNVSKNEINSVMLLARQAKVIRTLKSTSLSSSPVVLNIENENAIQNAMLLCDIEYLQAIMKLPYTFNTRDASIALYDSEEHADYLDRVRERIAKST